jgi:twitching motility protein PilI
MRKDYFHITVRKSVGLLIPIAETVEVVTCLRQEICPIPGVLFPLRGVLNQRGKLLWVLGLGDLLGLPPQQQRKHAQDQLTVVILGSETEANVRCGAVVSRLQGIVSLSQEAFTPVPSKFRPQARRFLAGITTLENQKAALLQGASVFQYLQESSVSNFSYSSSISL